MAKATYGKQGYNVLSMQPLDDNGDGLGNLLLVESKFVMSHLICALGADGQLVGANAAELRNLFDGFDITQAVLIGGLSANLDSRSRERLDCMRHFRAPRMPSRRSRSLLGKLPAANETLQPQPQQQHGSAANERRREPRQALSTLSQQPQQPQQRGNTDCLSLIHI